MWSQKPRKRPSPYQKQVLYINQTVVILGILREKMNNFGLKKINLRNISKCSDTKNIAGPFSYLLDAILSEGHNSVKPTW